MTRSGGQDATPDDDRRLGLRDLTFVAAFGPALGAALVLVMVFLFDGSELVRLVQRSAPFAPDADGLAFGMAAATILLVGLFGAAGWRATRGPVRGVSIARSVAMTIATFFAVWFWVLVAAVALTAD